MRSHIRPALLAVLAALALLLASCGDDDGGVAASGDAAAPATTEDPGGAAGDESSFPVTVQSGGLGTTIEAQPQAIVSLSPTVTEVLFAIDAGDQVVAADEHSNFPPEAPTTDLSGFDPNVEAIIAHEPDLVVLDASRDDVLAGLAAVDVPVLVVPAAASLDETYTQIETLGVATGRVAEAAALVGQMQSDIDALMAEVPERDEPLTYYHELDDTLYTVTSDTFIGELYALAGLENVADAADPDGEAMGYPQLSAEVLIEADPDLVFLADTKCCGQDASTFAARPGYGNLSAVQADRVVVLDDDIASRWGPRVVDLLEAIVDAVAAVEPAGQGA